MKSLTFIITLLLFSQAYAIPCMDMNEPQKTLCRQNKKILNKLNNMSGGNSCGAGLVSALGSCYGLGAVGESCSNFCASKAKVGTIDSLDAGSCETVADSIGLIYSAVSAQGYSCNIEGTTLYYKPGAGATPDKAAANTRRLCECR